MLGLGLGVGVGAGRAARRVESLVGELVETVGLRALWVVQLPIDAWLGFGFGFGFGFGSGLGLGLGFVSCQSVP